MALLAPRVPELEASYIGIRGVVKNIVMPWAACAASGSENAVSKQRRRVAESDVADEA